MNHPDPLVAVLDANVLYPQWLRDLLLTSPRSATTSLAGRTASSTSCDAASWSDHPDIDPGRFDAVTLAALHRAFPDASVTVDDDLVEQMDNAVEDRHVLAAAVTAAADLIATSNLDDFIASRYVTSGTSPSAFITMIMLERGGLAPALPWKTAA